MADTHRNVGRIVLFLQRISFIALDTIQTPVPCFFLAVFLLLRRVGSAALLRVCSVYTQNVGRFVRKDTAEKVIVSQRICSSNTVACVQLLSLFFLAVTFLNTFIKSAD